ncbi:hypothetical protein KUTeg_010858 [Tegillarca granosa]|uniref:Protein KTI12 homolog n=1 Tax=Tegillarca granosa TaxID=220873 RepID=A0ABQ9F7A9_TEGGR|nr:hypothetical protein KUTeg_010858 [Tegillarca granosa]
MPFILMCGFPSSGKTKRTEELKVYFESKLSKTVHIISDDSLKINKNEVYADSKKEKDVRGNLKSSVQRILNKDDVVILDSLNYIKGFRYELYCVTKACQTPHCVTVLSCNFRFFVILARTKHQNTTEIVQNLTSIHKKYNYGCSEDKCSW